jgi:hypothetical protein
MPQLNDTIYDIIDSTDSKNTGKYVTYNEVTEYFDGTAMDDTKCDGVIYRKRLDDGVYFRLNFDGMPSASWFGITGGGVDRTALINTAVSFDHIIGLKLDATDRKAVTITGAVDLNGKMLIAENDCYLTGSGSVENGYILGHPNRKIFDDGIDVTDLDNDVVSGAWFGMEAGYVNPGDVGYDNRAALQKAIDSFRDLPGDGDYYKAGVIVIPRATLKYYFSDVVEINRACTI